MPRQNGIVIADPERIKHVLDTNQRNYVKDTQFSYKPFMPVIGKGVVIVTSPVMIMTICLNHITQSHHNTCRSHSYFNALISA